MNPLPPKSPQAKPGNGQPPPVQHGEDPERRDFDAGDALSVAKRAESAKERQRRTLAGLKHLVESPDGRTWLWELLAFCGISRTSFDGTSRTYFNEGARNVGLRIQADLTRHFPDRYVQMLREEGDKT
jgi:hypothetical protein